MIASFTAGATSSNVEIVFSFDTTGSMAGKNLFKGELKLNFP